MPELTEIDRATGASDLRQGIHGESAPGKVAEPQPPHEAPPVFQLIVVFATGAAFLLGVLFEVDPLNGFAHWTAWKWPWRDDIDPLRLAVFVAPALALIYSVLRRAESASEPEARHRAPLSLALLAVASFLMQFLSMLAEPRGLETLRQLVLSPLATSYYLDASAIHGLRDWLRNFDRLSLGFHSATHPPGPVLFYYVFFKVFGFSEGALIGGCAVGAAATLGVIAMYAFAGLWTRDPRTRLIVSAFYALVPALTVFFPEMDQVYPILAMLLILFWCRSLEGARTADRNALYLGVTLFVTTFAAYNLLSVGAFFVYYAAWWLWRQGWTKPALLALARISAIAAITYAGLQLLLSLATGYNAVASFRAALASQRIYEAAWHRPYAIFALVDPYDFFLGAGIIALPLVIFYWWGARKEFDPARKDIALSLIGLATILTIDLTGILRGEASRVWLFLQPLLVVPVGLQLARFRGRLLLAIVSLQWLIVAALRAKMTFIRP